MPSATPAPRPGRQRSAAVDEVILAATLDQLGRDGYDGFTVASVIERAGVSSATLYRRWPTKLELVMAAVSTLAPEPLGVDTGTLAGDLEALTQDLAASALRKRDDVADAVRTERRRNA